MLSILIWLDSLEQWVHLHCTYACKQDRKHFFRMLKAFRVAGARYGTIRRYAADRFTVKSCHTVSW